jgi:hypothetical protein
MAIVVNNGEMAKAIENENENINNNGVSAAKIAYQNESENMKIMKQ